MRNHDSVIHEYFIFQEAECEKVRMDSKYAADAKIADATRMFQMQKASFDMEVNAKVKIILFSEWS